MTDDEIRSLLRDARASSALPAEVAGRLDDVLEGLRPASAAEPDPVVVPLRRRLAPRVLAAAAAVVLVAGVGVGLQQVLQQDGGSDNAASSGVAADRAVPSPAPAEAQAPEVVGQDSEEVLREGLAELSLDRASRQDLRAAARKTIALNGAVVNDRAPVPTYSTPDVARDLDSRSPAGCAAPVLAALPGSLSELVSYAGTPALLVVGPEQVAGLRQVELWSCRTHALITQQSLDLR